MIVPVLAALAGAVLPAAATAAPVAQPAGATQVREHAGTIVFSRFDRAEQVWRLAIRRPGGPAEVLPVAPSAAPFEADIGPNSAGRPQLIYRRSQGTGTSDLFVYALDGGGERPVANANDPGHDDTAPTIWGGRIAWTRLYGAGTRTVRPVVYTKTLSAPRSRPSTRLPGVPQRRCGDVERECGPTGDRYVRELELSGDNLAQTVGYSCRGCSGVGQHELRLVRISDRNATMVAFQVVGLSGQQLIGPSFSGRTLGWYKACLGDPSGCRRGEGGPFRYDTAGRTYRRSVGGPVNVTGYADTGATLFEAVDCSVETAGPFNDSCRIEEITPPPAFAPERASSLRRL